MRGDSNNSNPGIPNGIEAIIVAHVWQVNRRHKNVSLGTYTNFIFCRSFIIVKGLFKQPYDKILQNQLCDSSKY